MLNRFARALFTRLFTPVAMLLLRLRVSPDAVTVVGTVGVAAGALVLYPLDHLLIGSLVVTLFVFSDTLDGIMARALGRSSRWGAFLDSTLDRVGDAGIFGGLVLWGYGRGHDHPAAVLALACLCLGAVVSYAKARAEGLGMTANVGIAERADRLVAVLVAAGFVGMGVPRVFLTVVLALLAVASLVTVVQRVVVVRRQALAAATPATPATGAAAAPDVPARVNRDRLVPAAFSAGWRVVRLLPEPVAYGAFQAAADLAWRGRGRGVRQLEANLRRACPDLDAAGLRALSRRGMRSYLRYWCDAFRLPDWDEHRTVSTVRTEGEDAVHATLAGGRGVVLFLGHLGNWDHAGAWGAHRGLHVTTVAERLRPEGLFQRFVDYRRALGMTVLPLTDATGAAGAFGPLLRSLRGGGFVPLLADRDLTATGVEVEFLGERARMAPGPAALAVASGAALVPVSITYEDRPRGRAPRAPHGIVVTFHPEVPRPTTGTKGDQVAAMTQACADVLTAAVRAHPEDWHMLQPVFLADQQAPA